MRDPSFAKLVVFVNGCVPLALLLWDASQEQLGANPPEFALHTTGMIALIFLMLTLAVTPVRKLTGWNWLSHFRRMLGLFTYFYASLHLLLYLDFYVKFDLIRLWRAATSLDQLFILLGITAFLLMTPLALTSTNGMIKRLGAARWKQLHALIYPAAAAAVTHYWKSGKATPRLAYMFVVLLTVLLFYRLVAPRIAAMRKPSAAKPAAQN